MRPSGTNAAQWALFIAITISFVYSQPYQVPLPNTNKYRLRLVLVKSRRWLIRLDLTRRSSAL